MCCLFGMIDYKGIVSASEKKNVLSALLYGSEERGIDASGVAYVSGGNISIYKRPVPAHQLHPNISGRCRVVMGHSRLSTQGSEKINSNNHPFRGKVGSTGFALAHNGVIYNDARLRRELSLPKTLIQTDSYIAVQLLERENMLDEESVGRMAEQIDGSYAFSILDRNENLYLVRGSNPLCIRHFPDRGVYIYASTENIVQKAQCRLRGNPRKGIDVPISKGEIVRITPQGEVSRSHFTVRESEYPYSCAHSSFLTRYDYFHTAHSNRTYITQLKAVAQCYGFDSNEIDNLIAEGFTLTEIEDMIYDSHFMGYCF